MSWRRLRFTSPLTDILWLTLFVWAGFMVVIVGIAIGIARFNEVTSSVLEPAAQVAGWFAIFMGGYLNHDVLELHITHGMTRREFFQLAGLFVIAFAAFVALLMTVGFLIERLVYRVADWPHRIERDHLYSSGVQVHAVFTEIWLMCLIWTSAGALVGAAVYRHGNDGWLAIPLCLIPIGAGSIVIGDGWGPIESLADLFGDLSVHPAVAIPVCVLAIVAAVALTWPFVRDIPIRQRPA
jgi:hypothetical protein